MIRVYAAAIHKLQHTFISFTSSYVYLYTNMMKHVWIIVVKLDSINSQHVQKQNLVEFSDLQAARRAFPYCLGRRSRRSPCHNGSHEVSTCKNLSIYLPIYLFIYMYIESQIPTECSWNCWDCCCDETIWNIQCESGALPCKRQRLLRSLLRYWRDSHQKAWLILIKSRRSMA